MDTYEKKYNEALDKCKAYIDNTEKRWSEEFTKATKEVFKEIFPELRESEDERMIRVIGLALTDVPEERLTSLETTLKDCLSYLEKKKEQKHDGKKWIFEDEYQKDLDRLYNEGKDEVLNNPAKYGLQKEQKPVASWTIQDARPGDILNSARVQATIIFKGFNPDGKHIDAYCALQKGFFIAQELPWDRDFEPATQIWKDTLFDAMARKGYLWDAENKRLNKAVQKPAEWSEEDEMMATSIVNVLKRFEHLGATDMKIDWLLNRLKSLRPQPHWKPSEEQPSLPSNLDEAAEKYANKEYPDEASCGQWGTGDYEPPVDMEYPREIAKDSFKAGAEWVARQGAIKYWMAKDKDGHLLISDFKPYKRPTGYLDTDSFKWINISPVLSKELFPDIKLGDSPVEVIFQIRKKD